MVENDNLYIRRTLFANKVLLGFAKKMYFLGHIWSYRWLFAAIQVRMEI